MISDFNKLCPEGCELFIVWFYRIYYSQVLKYGGGRDCARK